MYAVTFCWFATKKMELVEERGPAAQPVRRTSFEAIAVGMRKTFSGIEQAVEKHAGAFAAASILRRRGRIIAFKRRVNVTVDEVQANPDVQLADLSVYTPEALDTRCSLRYEPRVVAALKRWWASCVAAVASHGKEARDRFGSLLVDREDFVFMFLRVFRALNVDYEEEAAAHYVLLDWGQDCEGRTRISEEARPEGPERPASRSGVRTPTPGLRGPRAHRGGGESRGNRIE